MLAASIPAGVHSEDADAFTDLLSRAKAANGEGNYASAESLATDSLEMLRRSGSADSVGAAEAHLELARALGSRRLVADSRALDSARRAVELFEGSVAANDPRRGSAHYVLATILSEMKRADEAVDQARQALRVQRAVDEDGSEPAAHSLRILGLNLERLGHADSARVCYAEAISMREQLDLPRDRWIGLLHADLARLEEGYGDLTAARAHLDRAVHELESSVGATDLGMIQAYMRYASLELDAGDYARSADLAHRSLEIAEATPQMDPLVIANIRRALAAPLAALGDFSRARALLDEAIPILEEHYGPHHTRTVGARVGLADALEQAGDTTAALAEIRELRRAVDADTASSSSSMVAEVLVTEAALLEAADPPAAIALAERAASIVENSAVPISEMTVTARTIQLAACQRSADAEGVDRFTGELRKAIDECRFRGSVPEAYGLERWADAERWRGRHERATELIIAATRMSREILVRNVRTLPDREALRFSVERSSPLEKLIAWCVSSSPDSSGRPTKTAAYDELIRWRGLVGAEIAGRRPPRRRGADSAVVQAHARWVDAKRELAQREVRARSHGEDEASGERLAELRVEVDAAERVWARLAPRRPSGDGEVGLDEVRASLRPDEALVSFAKVDDSDEPPRIVAFVIRAVSASENDSEAVRAIDLGGAAAIEQALARWLRCVSRPPENASADPRCRQDGVILRRLVWDPIAPAVAGAEDIDIVPDGPLHSLPWGALPGEGHTYLVEAAPAFHVLDAERDLLDRTEPVQQGVLLALGNVDFDGAAPDTASQLLAVSTRAVLRDCSASKPARFTPLPGTEKEVRSIEELWKDARVLHGSEATEAAFKELSPGNSVLHLATHGIVLEDSCGGSASRTRGVGGLEAIDTKPAPPQGGDAPAASVTSPPSPWLGRRVLLALAGANRAREHERDENEGLLTAEEVTTLDLRGTRWVVLSACRSGIGEVWAREGVLGLRRAFRLAGARSVIASEWDVEDEATQEWMEALYRARIGGAGSTADAMQRASCAVLAARRAQGRSTHPFYWAAFTASGE